ncbi:MAG: polysaccharide biosynthesis tyrosine autokinase [Prevotella sp.]|nr:polysaccharide biosynthesis tyrosine autokinase [Prevotella sp.]
MSENNAYNQQEFNVNLEEQEEDGLGIFSIGFLYRTILLNWIWFVLSLVICLGIAAIYLRYTPPVYSVMAKVLVKSGNTAGSSRVTSGVLTGQIIRSDGFDNEKEVLRSVSLAEDVVRDLKLYVSYTLEGTVTDKNIYGNQPILVDLDSEHLNELAGSINLVVENDGGKINVTGTTPMGKVKKMGTLPMTIHTKAGIITITRNPRGVWTDGKNIMATINQPHQVARGYAGSLSAVDYSEATSIAIVSRADILPQRTIDYIKQLIVCYNRQANDDKNEIALRTEKFINQRLEKINNELGSTEGAMENYKRDNRIAGTTSNAGPALAGTDKEEENLDEMNMQIMLMESLKEYMRMPVNKYQTLPSNVGLTDAAASALITQYNSLAMTRQRLMHSASESSPAVKTLSEQMDDLEASIYRAMEQTKRTMQIKRQAILNRYNKFNDKFENSFQQERILSEIGRQQSVKVSLYTMLLQKREENSISLAATADKGRLLDDPICTGQISPNRNMVCGIAAGAGLLTPLVILLLIELLRFRIEGHDEVARLTHCPIIADIALASDTAKTKADIVVHENKNNQMEEIFRGMRTNLQFMLKDGQNVIMFTSSTSGEGKTFTAANLAVSFALLGRKVLLVGLDIRRPRLSNLFGLHNGKAGITNLLVHDNPSIEMIKEQIVNSEVNNNLDLLMAGPVPPNPTELVSRPSLDKIFAELRKVYDYIIVDTAPVGLVTDTLQIGRVADVTCVICRADYTEKSAFRIINDFAINNKLPNVCIAINGIDMTKKKYGYAYGYGRYGKYGKYGYRGYGKYGKYGSYYGYNSYGYGGYGSYGYHSYGYGSYADSHYGNPDDDSIKR